MHGGNGTSYADGMTVAFMTDTTLYAIWNEKIVATLNVKDNKFTEGTTMTLGAKATTGIRKVELKVGNVILYSEEVKDTIDYNKSNLEFEKLNGIANLDFGDIDVMLSITSNSNQVGNTTVKVKNNTIGNERAIKQFAQTVNKGNTFERESIFLINDIKINAGVSWVPIGYYKENKPCFKGLFDRQRAYNYWGYR